MTTLEIIKTILDRLDRKGRIRGCLPWKRADGKLVIYRLEKLDADLLFANQRVMNLMEEVENLQVDRAGMKAASARVFQELQKAGREKAALLEELKASQLKRRKLLNKLQRKGA